MSKPQPEGIDHQQLRSELKKLHAELRAIRTFDEEEQKLLQLLDADIKELLGRKDDSLQFNPDSRQRIYETLAQVEASHPRVPLLIRQIVDSLAYLGI
jgi:uncharacterized protein DUF4404